MNVQGEHSSRCSRSPRRGFRQSDVQTTSGYRPIKGESRGGTDSAQHASLQFVHAVVEVLSQYISSRMCIHFEATHTSHLRTRSPRRLRVSRRHRICRRRQILPHRPRCRAACVHRVEDAQSVVGWWGRGASIRMTHVPSDSAPSVMHTAATVTPTCLVSAASQPLSLPAGRLCQTR